MSIDFKMSLLISFKQR